MSFNKRSGGFSLTEVLVSLALSGVVLTIMGFIMQGQAKLQSSSTTRQSMDEQLSAAAELISLQLREATVPRVVGATLPPNFTLSSSATQLSIVTTQPENVVPVLPHPLNFHYSASLITQIGTNRWNRSCGAIFSGNELAVIRTGNAAQWVRVALAPCGLGFITQQQAVSYNYTPDVTIAKTDIVTYRVKADTPPRLIRQINGGAEQTVAYNIEALNLQYSDDGVTFSAAANQPIAVRFSLKGSGNGRPTVTQTVFMRDSTAPEKETP